MTPGPTYVTLGLERAPVFNVTDGAKFALLNSRDALDAPGEYYVNTTSGVATFYPPRPLAPGDFVLATVDDTLLSGAGVAYFTVANVAFLGVRGTAVALDAAHDVALLNCSVLSTGADAVVFSGNATRVFVGGVNVTHAGGSGVVIGGGGDRATLAPSGNVVRDCAVLHYERVCHTYHPALHLSGVATAALHNELGYGPHAALSFVAQLIEQRGHVSDADLASVRKAGFTDAQILEITATTCTNLFTNYMNSVCKTEIDSAFPKVSASNVKKAA